MKLTGTKKQSGFPREVVMERLENRIVPNLKGYDGTYKGVMSDMKIQQAGLKKVFKAGNSF